jgi:hypothetical protein
MNVNIHGVVFLPYPSEILLGIDKAALLISEVKEKSLILGNIFVVL